MKKNLLILSTILAVTPMSLLQAREQRDPTMYTATTSGSTTTTTMRGETIQSLASQAVGNSNRGKNLANAAIGVTAAGVAMTCSNPVGAAKCKYFVAGLVASMAVRMFMSGASDTSHQTLAGVTTVDDQYNPNTNGPTPGTNKPGTNYQEDPDWVNGNKALNDLKKKGWKVDVPSGNITTPSGKSFNASVVNSTDSMRASGASDSTIKAFQDAMAKIPAIAAAKTKSSDSGDSMFADDNSAGGSKAATPTAGVGEGQNNYGSQLYSKNNNGTIERDPAQVAGMSKDFNGSKIGVAADSLFDMIDRRYNYHQKAGSFIGGVPTVITTSGPAN